MGTGGLGIKMSCVDIRIKRDLALRNARETVTKIIKQEVLNYYEKNGNSFKKFDFEKACKSIKEKAHAILRRKQDMVALIGKNELAKIVSVRNTAISHFMQEIDLKAFEEFENSMKDVDDDFEDR